MLAYLLDRFLKKMIYHCFQIRPNNTTNIKMTNTRTQYLPDFLLLSTYCH